MKIRVLGVLAILFALSVPAHAFSVTVQSNSVFGDTRVSFGYMTFDSSYPTGGEALSIATASNGWIFHTYKFMTVLPVGGYTFLYDNTNAKVKAYVSAGGTVSVTDGGHTHTISITNTSTGTAVKYTNGTLKVSGNSTSVTTASGTTGITATLAAAAQAEVANGTNLSALTAVPYMLFGI